MKYVYIANDNHIKHYGIKGQQWGKRRFQNEDGTLTEAGRRRYLDGSSQIGPSPFKVTNPIGPLTGKHQGTTYTIAPNRPSLQFNTGVRPDMADTYVRVMNNPNATAEDRAKAWDSYMRLAKENPSVAKAAVDKHISKIAKESVANVSPTKTTVSKVSNAVKNVADQAVAYWTTGAKQISNLFKKKK